MPIVPGIFTVGNIISGFISLVLSLSGNFVSASFLIILGVIFDLLDGKIARMTHATSRFGVEFDSLADFLTFGIAPSFMLFAMGVYDFHHWGFLVPILYIIAGAFRLARYNLTAEHNVKTDFRGMPLPLAGIFIASYVLFSYELWGELRYKQNLTPALVLLSWLLISNAKYPATITIKPGKLFKLKLGVTILIILAILCKPKLLIFPVVAIYILYSFIKEIYWFISRFQRRGHEI